MKEHIYLGIDIGGTNTKIGLASLDKGLIAHHSFPTEGQVAFSNFLPRLKSAVNKICDDNKVTTPLFSAGVGAPDVNFFTGMMEGPPNLSWGTFSLKSELEKALGLPVWLDNDANLFALAERDFGAAKGIKNFILVTLGTGVGTGVVVNGQIVRGHTGLAGEGGHIEVLPKGRLCPCGKLGHLEAYLGAKGLKQTAWEICGESLDPKSIGARFEHNDPLSHRILDFSAEKLATACAGWVSLLGPEKIILAGGIAHLGDKFCQMVEQHMDQLIFHNLKKTYHVQLGLLPTDYGALLGAASLAMQMGG